VKAQSTDPQFNVPQFDEQIPSDDEMEELEEMLTNRARDSRPAGPSPLRQNVRDSRRSPETSSKER